MTSTKPSASISAGDLVNYEEAAEILELSLQTVRIYKIKDQDFPDPITDTRSPVWLRSDIVAYKERRASKLANRDTAAKRERRFRDAPAATKRARSESARKTAPTPPEVDFSKLVTINDIAEILGVTPQTARKYSHTDSKFPEPSYVKKTHWWLRDDVLAYQEHRAARTQPSTTPSDDDDPTA